MTLFTVGHVADALKPLFRTSRLLRDISRLIDEGAVRPFGYLGRIPLFALPQVGEVALALAKKRARRRRATRTSQRNVRGRS